MGRKGGDYFSPLSVYFVGQSLVAMYYRYTYGGWVGVEREAVKFMEIGLELPLSSLIFVVGKQLVIYAERGLGWGDKGRERKSGMVARKKVEPIPQQPTYLPTYPSFNFYWGLKARQF